MLTAPQEAAVVAVVKSAVSGSVKRSFVPSSGIAAGAAPTEVRRFPPWAWIQTTAA
nr:hypothetical protein [Sutterella parvirubra]